MKPIVCMGLLPRAFGLHPSRDADAALRKVQGDADGAFHQHPFAHFDLTQSMDVERIPLRDLPGLLRASRVEDAQPVAGRRPICAEARSRRKQDTLPRQLGHVFEVLGKIGRHAFGRGYGLEIHEEELLAQHPAGELFDSCADLGHGISSKVEHSHFYNMLILIDMSHRRPKESSAASFENHVPWTRAVAADKGIRYRRSNATVPRVAGSIRAPPASDVAILSLRCTASRATRPTAAFSGKDCERAASVSGVRAFGRLPARFFSNEAMRAPRPARSPPAPRSRSAPSSSTPRRSATCYF